MKRIRIFFLLVVIFTSAGNLFAQKKSIKYTLSLPEPHSHYFIVNMELTGFKGTTDIKMPVWAPGSYLIREFPKNVVAFNAFNNKSEQISASKINKNTWRLKNADPVKTEVVYKVYAFEHSIRTSFLDADHGYINGTSVFMFVEGSLDIESVLEIHLPEDWNLVSTALPRIDEESWIFKANDYDQLADCPIEMGNHEEFDFMAAGIKHRVAMYGEGNFDVVRLKKDMTAIIEHLTDIFGENPNDDYLFIIHNIDRPGGGLEHANSTTIQVNRWDYEPQRRYYGFLSLVAHEYFHLWVVKRIRPDALGPFDYSNENYTHLLWVMEGFARYYSELVLRQLGYTSEERFINKLGDDCARVNNQPGNAVQPVSAASFDAWIKFYRSNENSVNTEVSYYSKGAVIASMLDLLIIHNTEGEKNLGDVLKHIYNTQYKKRGTGITDQEMKDALEEVSNSNLDEFYANYINGTENLDLGEFVKYAGLELSVIQPHISENLLGLQYDDKGGVITVKRVTEGSSAWKAGLNVRDEIISFDSYRVKGANISKILNTKSPGDTMEVLVSRRGKMKLLTLEIAPNDSNRYLITKKSKPSELEVEVFEKWLKGKN